MCFPSAIPSGSASWIGSWFAFCVARARCKWRWNVPRSQCRDDHRRRLGMSPSSACSYERTEDVRRAFGRTLSFTCRSSKKHSFLDAGTSIICPETSTGSTSKIASHIADSAGVYGRSMVVEALVKFRDAVFAVSNDQKPTCTHSTAVQGHVHCACGTRGTFDCHLGVLLAIWRRVRDASSFSTALFQLSLSSTTPLVFFALTTNTPRQHD